MNQICKKDKNINNKFHNIILQLKNALCILQNITTSVPCDNICVDSKIQTIFEFNLLEFIPFQLYFHFI